MSMKLQIKNLIDVFFHPRDRDIARSLGNRTATLYPISLVQQAIKSQEGQHSWRHIRGVFELAANAFRFVPTTGTTGRRWVPTPSIFPTRELKYG